jgi:MFS family permease
MNSTPGAPSGRFGGWLARFGFPTKREQRVFVFTAMLDALGTGLILPVTLLYFTLDRDLPAIQVGIGLSIAGALGTLMTPVSGALVDRYGARATGVACHLVSSTAFASYLLVDSFWSFLLVVCLAQCADRMFRPAKTALAVVLADAEDRVRLLAVHRSLRNVGYGLGGALATIALAAGTHEAYVIVILGNACSYLITAGLLTKLPLPPRKRPDEESGGARFVHVLRDRPYVALTLLNMVMLLHASVLEIGMPLWIVEETDAPKALAAALFTANTILVVGLQVWSSRFAKDVAGASRAYGWSGCLLLTMSALFALAADVGTAAAIGLLVLAMLSLSVGEVLATVGEWGVSLGLAPEVGQGRYLALFSTGSAAQIAFGPALVTFLLVTLHGTGWFVLGALFLLAGTGAMLVARSADRPRVGSATAVEA